MVMPDLVYAGVSRLVRDHTALPAAAYHVSGEDAMLRAAAERGWLDYDPCLLESLLAPKRAGADLIFTHGALDAPRLLRDHPRGRARAVFTTVFVATIVSPGFA